MLVLSRRVEEKLLFPGLGISLEIVRVKGNTVRIGIDAPRDIRVVRGELAEKEAASSKKKSALAEKNPALAEKECAENERAEKVRGENGHAIEDRKLSAVSATAGESKAEIQRRLNAANLAIHLAQNQLQQGRNRNVAYALDDAIACLRSLESAVLGKLESLDIESGQTDSIASMRDSNSEISESENVDYASTVPVLVPDTGIEAVRERPAGYATSQTASSGKQSVSPHMQSSHRQTSHRQTALIQTGDTKLGEQLSALGYDIVSVNDGFEMIRYVAENRQPDVVLMQAVDELGDNEYSNDDQSGDQRIDASSESICFDSRMSPSGDPAKINAEIQIDGIDGLQPCARPIRYDNRNFSGWFTSQAAADRLLKMLEVAG